jgi:hypothetical protein
MSSQQFYRSISILLLASLLGGIFMFSGGNGFAADAQIQPAAGQSHAVMVEEDLNHEVFLPLVRKSWGKSIFGIQLHSITAGGGLNQVRDAGAYWLRFNGLLWSDVEPAQGDRNWDNSMVSSLEQELINASQAGMEVVLIVRSTPEWARQVPDLACGRIKIEHIPAFTDFVAEAVARYSQPPYNVRYWQIWNEPDAPIAQSEAPYGCWGNANEPYFGAGYYTEILKQVFPAVKQTNPNAQVVVGGLLLPCDPHHEPIACKQSTYLEGILINGGKDFFDAVSFHAYDAYIGEGNFNNPPWISAWDTTGPVVAAKGSYLKGVLNQHGAGDKMLFNSEGAIICGPAGSSDPEIHKICTSEDFENTKAYYVTKIYAAAIATGLEANIWYSVTGWRYSGLLKSNLEPLPAYHAYQFARIKLGNAVYIGQDESHPNLFDYKFNRAGKEMRLVWSKDGSPQLVPVTGGSQVWDALGNSVLITDGSVIVEKNPYYIEYP